MMCIKPIRGSGGWIALLLLALLVAAACGKKDWPSVQDEKEAFAWQAITAEQEGSCLTVSARLTGAAQNLASVVLELEAAQDLCRECPFQASRRTVYPLSAAQVKQEGLRLWLSHCGLEKGRRYRLRLLGRNRFSGMEAQISQVVVLSDD